MLQIIVVKEFLENVKTLKFAIGMMVVLMLVPITSYISAKDYGKRRWEYQSAVEDEQARGGKWDIKIYRRPSKLGIFCSAYDRWLGPKTDIHKVPFATEGYGGYRSQYTRYASALRFVDLAFVAKILMSLLALFLAYDAISGENERGTLRLMLSNPVPRDTVLVGKLLGGGLCLLIPLTAAFLLAIIVALMFGDMAFSRDDWMRIVGMGLASGLYLIAVFALGMAISCATKRSATTLIVSLFLWTGLFIVLPNVTGFVARHIRPVTPARVVAAEVGQIQMEGYKKTGPLWESQDSRERQKAVELSYQIQQDVWRRVENRFLNQAYAQTELARYLGMLSPGEALVSCISTLCGTDLEPYRRFMAIAREYYAQFKVWRLTKDRSKPLAHHFSYDDESLRPILARAIPALAILALFGILCFMVAYMLFLRYEV